MQDYKEILLTRGKVALVDIDDFEWLNQFNWYATKARNSWYAVRTNRYGHIAMHREILGIDNPSIQVDHKNHNGLDNRRENIRIATPSQNKANSQLTKPNRMGYTGVSYSPKNCKARPYQVRCRGKFIGSFKTLEEAALAYDERAKEVFGEFATTNF